MSFLYFEVLLKLSMFLFDRSQTELQALRQQGSLVYQLLFVKISERHVANVVLQMMGMLVFPVELRNL